MGPIRMDKLCKIHQRGHRVNVRTIPFPEVEVNADVVQGRFDLGDIVVLESGGWQA
jgi:hypothetical protein